MGDTNIAAHNAIQRDFFGAPLGKKRLWGRETFPKPKAAVLGTLPDSFWERLEVWNCRTAKCG